MKSKMKIKNMFQNKNGFTLIEILVTIAIFTIILGIATITTKSFSDTVNLDNAGKIIGTNIKLAKMRSVGALNDTNYGVLFESDKITVFGVSDSTNDKVVNLPDNVEIWDISLTEYPVGSGSNMAFDRLTGTTKNFGTIGIRLINNPSEKKQIVINEEGQIDYAPFPISSVFPIKNARHVHYDLKWNIENSTILRFERGADTNDIDTTACFNADKTEFDWNGETITGSSQTAKIHGWLIGGKTVLCVILDFYQTEGDTLKIYFVDSDGAKKIATYTNVGGVISVARDLTNTDAMLDK